MAVRPQRSAGLTAASASGGDAVDLEKIELDCLLEAVFRRYGFDFREYAPASLRRRVQPAPAARGAADASRRCRNGCFAIRRSWSGCCSTSRSTSRRCSATRRSTSRLREKVVPLLRTYPFTRIWVAGCSTGEEVYSLAILLDEERVYDRTRIYATDINEGVLERARLGVFPLAKMQDYTRNYIAAGGKARVRRLLHVGVRRRRVRPLAAAQRRVRTAQPRVRTGRSTSSTWSSAAT